MTNIRGLVLREHDVEQPLPAFINGDSSVILKVDDSFQCVTSLRPCTL